VVNQNIVISHICFSNSKSISPSNSKSSDSSRPRPSRAGGSAQGPDGSTLKPSASLRPRPSRAGGSAQGPEGYTLFSNAAESKGIITTEFKGVCGVYLWTNLINGQQYVGSSIDLSTRLSNYFKSSYLIAQGDRGSAIGKALLKHGHDNFKLEVFPMGPSISRSEVNASTSFILLEQYCLNTYALVYNIRRIALGPAPYSTPGDHAGAKNPQFGNVGPSSAVWNKSHTDELRKLWSISRATPILIFDSTTFKFNRVIYGLEGLAGFLGVHVNTARSALNRGGVYKGWVLSTNLLTVSEVKTIVESTENSQTTKSRPVYVYNSKKSKLLATFPTVNAVMQVFGLSGRDIKALCTSPDKLCRNTYFFSYEEIENADNSSPDNSGFVPVPANLNKGIPVYGFNPEATSQYKEWGSLRECVADLEGNRNFNTKSLSLRIQYNEKYHGYFVSHTPFN
jgi:group I intron endonuclease